LGRTASGLTKLFDDLRIHKCNLISLKDNLDLSTASGRLNANIIASVASYETEVRGERVRAGQQAARGIWISRITYQDPPGHFRDLPERVRISV